MTNYGFSLNKDDCNRNSPLNSGMEENSNINMSEQYAYHTMKKTNAVIEPENFHTLG